MITSEKILALPGINPNFATASNGGTKLFTNNKIEKGPQTWINIEFNGDNGYFKHKGDPRLNEIAIIRFTYDPSLGSKFEDMISKTELFRGMVTEMSELESLYNKHK